MNLKHEILKALIKAIMTDGERLFLIASTIEKWETDHEMFHSEALNVRIFNKC